MDSQRNSQEPEFSSPYGAFSQYSSSSSQMPQVPITPPPSIGGVPVLTTHFPLPTFAASPFQFRPFLNPRALPAQRAPLPSPKSPIPESGDSQSPDINNLSQLPPDSQEYPSATQPMGTQKLPIKRRGTRVSEVSEGSSKGPSQKKGKKTIQENIKQEGVRREHWKDHWVVQLIHIRCGMNSEFTKAHKQGVDLWSKVAIQLASLHPDCDKDGESCRKRWGRVYEDYKKDKLYLSVSGHDRKIKCQWFDIVDQYMSDRATVVIDASASAHTPTEDVDVEETVNIQDSQEKGDTHDLDGDSPSSMIGAKLNAPFGRKKKVGKIEESLTEMATSSSLLLLHMKESTEERRAEQNERMKMLGQLVATVGGMLDVMKSFKKD